jgi:hypothetical protein
MVRRRYSELFAIGVEGGENQVVIELVESDPVHRPVIEIQPRQIGCGLGLRHLPGTRKPDFSLQLAV